MGAPIRMVMASGIAPIALVANSAQAQGEQVNASGCTDTDGDGVEDGADQCPSTPAGDPVITPGAPIRMVTVSRTVLTTAH